jgi:hypothetical protein
MSATEVKLVLRTEVFRAVKINIALFWDVTVWCPRSR